MVLKILVLVLLADVFLVVGLRVGEITTAENAIELLNFALSVSDVISDITADDSDINKTHQNQLLLKITAHREMVYSDTFSDLILKYKLDKINESVTAIQSSLADVENILRAETGKMELINVFKQRFEEQNVVNHVNFIKSLLTFESPTNNVELITLVRNETRCGAFAFNNFRDFYLNLTVHAALLHLTYVSATTQSGSTQAFVESWSNAILEADQIFTDQVPICEERFESDVQADLESIDDPNDLKTLLDQRYPDKNFDILFYSGIGTNQLHAFRYASTKSRFFWARKMNEVNKILVLTDTAGTLSWDKDSTEDLLEECIDELSVDELDSILDRNAAIEVLTNVVSCNGLAYPIETAIVYFESEEFPTGTIIPHSDSPVVEVTKEDVTLRFCFQSGLECWFSTGYNESSGRFRIRVYPNLENDVKEGDFLIGSSREIALTMWFWVVTFLMMVTYVQIF